MEKCDVICPAIVVIAYNRKDSLTRLLCSLNEAYYPDDTEIPLIISIDKSDSEDVLNAALHYEWKHGTKYVRHQAENLGLKKHVLLCGDISEEYGSIIMLEDDLFVSPLFYHYSCKALEMSVGLDRIAGISLYGHRLNVHKREPFEPLDDGFDNFYIQFASSWGQAFLKEQWSTFRTWYEEHKTQPLEAPDVPKNVSSWSERSWLKFYIKYLIETDRYFSYPRISLTTNFGDEGTHASDSVNDLQVPLAGMNGSFLPDYRFAALDESNAVYDAFFENTTLEDTLFKDLPEGVTIDLYGTKEPSLYKRYVLSSSPLPYRIKRSYGLRMRPVDSNIIHNIEGDALFLYDTKEADTPPKTDPAGRYLYDYRALKAKEMISILKYRIRKKIGK